MDSLLHHTSYPSSSYRILNPEQPYQPGGQLYLVYLDVDVNQVEDPLDFLQGSRYKKKLISSVPINGKYSVAVVRPDDHNTHPEEKMIVKGYEPYLFIEDPTEWMREVRERFDRNVMDILKTRVNSPSLYRIEFMENDVSDD